MHTFFDERINDYVFSMGIPKWKVIAVQPQKDYTLILTFIDGKKRIYNALPLLKKSIYSQLKDLNFFMKARVEGDTVAWNTDIDIAPEHLYEYSSPLELSTT